MRLNSNIQIHEVAGERIAMMHDNDQMTRVISLNETAIYLWNALQDKDFEKDDIVSLLLEQYEVDAKTAEKDALIWINNLVENGMLA